MIRSGQNTNPLLRVAIIGAGPAGLTAARMLQDSGKAMPVLFEKADRIGGKSMTISAGSVYAELGTCYTMRAHRYIHYLCDRYGMELSQIGEQLFDDMDFVDFVRAGPGPPLAAQMLKYLMLQKKLLRKIAKGNHDARLLKALAMPIADWLDCHKLPKMKRFMYRAMTVMGYGSLDVTPTIHALRWCDQDLIISGYKKLISYPTLGWSNLWETISADLDIHLSTPILNVERRPNHITIHTKQGTVEFDALINTIPLHDFTQITQPTLKEAQLAAATKWLKYSTTIISAAKWYDSHVTEGYSAAMNGEVGLILASRYEGKDDSGRHIYTIGQYAHETPDADMREYVLHQLIQKGAIDPRIVHQKTWDYFPHYTSESIRAGLIENNAQMQGELRTWHSGATLSHEAISNISTHNEMIITDILATLTAETVKT